MGRRITTAAREKKRILSKSRKLREEIEHKEQYGISKKLGTPSNLLKIASFNRRRAKKVEDFKKILDTAKLLAVTQEDFQYCGLSARSAKVLANFRKELERRMSAYIGKKEPDSVLDFVSSKCLQEMVDLWEFVPVDPPVGMVPKARKYKSGRLQVLMTGEPDYDFLVSRLRISVQKEK